MFQKQTVPLLAALVLLLASCGQAITPSPPLTEVLEETGQAVNPSPPPTEVLEESDPLVTEEPEYTWSQLLGRDSILPIYEPEFIPADQADYDDAELVMGVAIDGEAKAYPVGPLNRREMVNDELKGIPILVTW
jgi:hypothetical protein